MTISDNEDPDILNCPDPVTAYAPSGGSASVTWNVPTAVDNSGTVTLVGGNEPGDVFNLGNHLVTYVAVDQYNNQATCNFIVSVLGRWAFICLCLVCLYNILVPEQKLVIKDKAPIITGLVLNKVYIQMRNHQRLQLSCCR